MAEIAAMYNLTNRMAMATNMLPNDEYSAQARPVWRRREAGRGLSAVVAGATRGTRGRS